MSAKTLFVRMAVAVTKAPACVPPVLRERIAKLKSAQSFSVLTLFQKAVNPAITPFT